MQIKILFLEDDNKDFNLISEKIKAEWDSDITRVVDRDTFTEKMQNGNFDLVLADFALPAFNGLTVLEIKNNFKPDIPFIFVSGHIGEERAIEALTNGAADYVLKNKIEKLIPAINRTLNEAEEKRRRSEAEEAQRKSEASLKEAQEIAKIGSWEVDLRTFKSIWSENCYVIYGLKPYEIKPDYEFFINRVHPEDLHLFDKANQEVNNNRKTFSFELRIIMPGGGFKWVENRLIPVFDGDKLIKLKGVIIDISDRKKTQERLKQNEILLNITGKTAKIGGWVVELPDYEIKWSDEVKLIHEVPLGYEPTAEESLKFYAPEYRQVMIQKIEECIGLGVPFDETLELITAKGNRIWVRSMGEAIRDDAGKTLRVQGAFQDITESKKNEAEIVKLAERLQTTFESITDAFFTLDKNWRFTFVNKKAENILQHSKEELIGNNIWEIFPEAVNSTFFINYKKALAENRTIEFEEYYLPMDVWVEVRAYPSEEGLTIYFHDKTEKKKLIDEIINAKELAEHSNKLKDAFIANISHEIRTPLNGILGLTHLIKEIYLPQMQPGDEELFNGVENSSKRLSRTVDMILNFSRLQTENFPAKKEKVSLKKILQSLINEFEAEANEKKIEINFENCCGNSEIIADEFTITQAISNLLDNAIKYTEKGFVKISIKEDSKNYILEVADSGIGISSQFLERIFEPYIQEEMGYRRRYEGVGLGLSLVKKFLSLNDASITVHSEKNEGATFQILFHKPVIQNENRKKSILVVEDEAINQLSLKMLLKSKYNVLISDSAAGAREKLVNNPVDLILMDISIKGDTNGLKLTKELKENMNYKHVPVIIVTAYAFAEDRKNSILSGADDYISKPYNNNELLEKIEKVL